MEIDRYHDMKDDPSHWPATSDLRGRIARQEFYNVDVDGDEAEATPFDRQLRQGCVNRQDATEYRRRE